MTKNTFRLPELSQYSLFQFCPFTCKLNKDCENFKNSTRLLQHNDMVWFLKKSHKQKKQNESQNKEWYGVLSAQKITSDRQLENVSKQREVMLFLENKKKVSKHMDKSIYEKIVQLPSQG